MLTHQATRSFTPPSESHDKTQEDAAHTLLPCEGRSEAFSETPRSVALPLAFPLPPCHVHMNVLRVVVVVDGMLYPILPATFFFPGRTDTHSSCCEPVQR